ncbi:MAG TPA: hypothetical protein VEV17_01530 [Bryobacteraceae bacterium]|nr:hypothetical protein [Bryobacteraceae bacterium]
MNSRAFVPEGALASVLVVGLLAGTAAGQSSGSAAKPWTPARTSFGQPDLQGLWNNVTITPLERPRDLAGKQFFTEEEAAAYEKRMVEGRDSNPNAAESVADPVVWWERGVHIVSTRRTSLIVDPPDGRIPPLTPEAQKRMQEARAQTRLHPADGPEDRSLQERCLLSTSTGPPTLPAPYNNNIQIVQTPGYVMLVIEMIHEVRVIPLDGRPHLPVDVRLWMGDPRGHWEGDTLVVDSTNFTAKTHFRGSDENLHLVERFTRVAPDTVLYQFTVDDPTAFTRPWTGELPLHASEGPMYEFACHEGNVAMDHMLINARKAEKAAAQPSKATQ